MRFRLVLILIIMLSLVALPYIYAAISSGSENVFVGFLFNPIDGNSYLAKMYQGWRGDWLFKLPFTAEPGQGGYLFLFYLFLGHLARWLSLPLILIFHLARLLSTILMMLVLYRFFVTFLGRQVKLVYIFTLVALGSGLGWLIFPFGYITSDFWVAEAYPFLSAYANPHFPLGLALMMLLLLQVENTRNRRTLTSDIVSAIYALILVIVAPFGIVILIVILLGMIFWQIWTDRHQIQFPNLKFLFSWVRNSHLIRLVFWVCVGAGPLLVYDLFVARMDPVLSGWNAQNQTPSPPLWDLVISFSPVLWMAVYGFWVNMQRRGKKARIFLVWAGLGIMLLYLPFGLQRRFMMGLFVPLVGLAGLGLDVVSEKGFKWVGLVSVAILILSISTNIIVLLIGLFGIRSHDPMFYLAKAEDQALDWIEANTQPDSLVLAAPDTGLFIPGQTGRRVLYGHPFETVGAGQEGAAVTEFFEGMDSFSAYNFLITRKVDYVFYGPREHAIGELPDINGLETVYSVGNVEIFKFTIHE